MGDRGWTHPAGDGVVLELHPALGLQANLGRLLRLHGGLVGIGLVGCGGADGNNDVRSAV